MKLLHKTKNYPFTCRSPNLKTIWATHWCKEMIKRMSLRSLSIKMRIMRMILIMTIRGLFQVRKSRGRDIKRMEVWGRGKRKRWKLVMGNIWLHLIHQGLLLSMRGNQMFRVSRKADSV